MRQFLWLSNIPLYICTTDSLSIHLSINGHLGCFHVLPVVNNAAKSIGAHVSFSFLVSSGYMPSSGTAESCGSFRIGASGMTSLRKNLFLSSDVIFPNHLLHWYWHCTSWIKAEGFDCYITPRCWFLKSYSFTYFRLSWSLLLLGLFSSCDKQGLLFGGATCTSHCSSFSCCRAWALGAGFSSYSCSALEHRLSTRGPQAELLYGMWNLPRPGIKSKSPPLAGRFFANEPPGKPEYQGFVYLFCVLVFSINSLIARVTFSSTTYSQRWLPWWLRW